MGQTVDFKCPCCGGYVEFDPATQRFKCLYCGQILREDELQEKEAQPETAASQPEAEQGSYHAYHCTSCGAQIVTGDTTAATRCYYCHNPVVLQDRLEGEFRPDGVIPFAMDKQGAKESFRKFIKKRRFVDRAFYSTAQMEDFSGVYYPYWMGDVKGDVSFRGEGTQQHVTRSAQYTTTVVKHYQVEREGKVHFRNMFRKALKAADRTLADGIHPYRTAEMKPYAPGYLSGFSAEMRDVASDDARSDMLQEMELLASGMIKKNSMFQNLQGNCTFTVNDTQMKYVLLPVWVLTYKGRKGKTYYYMMNGQNGLVCGKLPIDWKKLLGCCLGVGAAVFALMCGGGALLW